MSLQVPPSARGMIDDLGDELNTLNMSDTGVLVEFQTKVSAFECNGSNAHL